MVKNKRLFSSILSIIMLCLALNITPAKAQESNAGTSRLSGNDRYETSVAISKSGWSEADTVIITTGLDYPDALSASSLAKSNDSPILLTEKKAMRTITVDEIKRLKATNAILVGGTNVIGVGVENQLKSLGITFTRIGGSDRYDTSKKVAETIGVDNGIIVATGLNYPDALSIAPIAGIKSMPILLSPKAHLGSGAEKFIEGKNIPVSYIVGGNSVLDPNVEKGVPNGKRLGGSNRYDTNLNINREFASDLNFDTIYLATGNDFPDALSGSALAAKNNAPIFLTDKNSISSDIIKIVKEKNVKQVVIMGGNNVVSKNVEDTVSDVIKNRAVNVESISLNKTACDLIVGDTDNLIATVKPSNATNKELIWTSLNNDIATVDNTGKVTAVGEGATTITVTTKDGGYKASCNVNVNKLAISSIEDISVNVFKNDIYNLPSSVTASMNNGKVENVGIIWQTGTVDTSKEGIYTFKGVVEGYNEDVILTLNVKEYKPDIFIYNYPSTIINNVCKSLSLNINNNGSKTVTVNKIEVYERGTLVNTYNKSDLITANIPTDILPSERWGMSISYKLGIWMDNSYVKYYVESNGDSFEYTADIKEY